MYIICYAGVNADLHSLAYAPICFCGACPNYGNNKFRREDHFEARM